MRRGYIDTSRGQIHYHSEGKGDAVVFLHQALRSGESFSRILPLVGQHYRAIAIDLPGRGMSDPLPAPFEVPDMARSVIETLDGLGIKKFRVFGGQTGAAVSVELAAAYPDRVEGVALLAFPFISDEKMRQQYVGLAEGGINTKAAGPGNIGFPLVEPEASGAHLARLWHWIAVRLWQGKGIPPQEAMTEEDAGYVSAFLLDILTAKKGAGINNFYAVFRYNSPVRLPLIKAPVLLIQSTGTHERTATLRSQEAAKLIPRAKIASLENADSFANYFKAKEISDIIVKFFKHPGV